MCIINKREKEGGCILIKKNITRRNHKQRCTVLLNAYCLATSMMWCPGFVAHGHWNVAMSMVKETQAYALTNWRGACESTLYSYGVILRGCSWWFKLALSFQADLCYSNANCLLQWRWIDSTAQLQNVGIVWCVPGQVVGQFCIMDYSSWSLILVFIHPWFGISRDISVTMTLFSASCT